MLLKQDKSEAVMAVDGRLEFIEKEMYDTIIIWAVWRFHTADSPHSKRVEKQISDIQEKSESKKMEVSFSVLTPLEGPCFLEEQRAGQFLMEMKVVCGFEANSKPDRSINYRLACSSSNRHHK